MKHDSGLKIFLYRVFSIIPDGVYVRLQYRKNFGKWPNLRNPKTFNEKLNWLKLNDHNPQYTKMVDKFAVKDYVAEKIGTEYVIPTYGVWDRAEDIDFDALPKKFVLKATHDSGRVIICNDKSKLDREWAIEAMRQSLKRNFYAVTREWPYKDVKPRIIAEILLETNEDGGVPDYKFFCFNGKVKFLKVDVGRFTDHRANYYDKDFKLLEFREAVFELSPDSSVKRPSHLDEMIRLAEILADKMRFVRVDFYEVDDKVYFGEITFFPGSGMHVFDPEYADEMVGSYLRLGSI